MNKRQFLGTAQPITVSVAGQPVNARVLEMSTGSVGWNVNGKVTVTLPDGTQVPCQFNGNITAIGSKNWADSGAPALPNRGTGTGLAVAGNGGLIRR